MDYAFYTKLCFKRHTFFLSLYDPSNLHVHKKIKIQRPFLRIDYFHYMIIIILNLILNNLTGSWLVAAGIDVVPKGISGGEVRDGNNRLPGGR